MTTPTNLRPTGRRRKLALAAGFLALLCAPVLLWPLLRGGCDTTNYENRTLAAFPDGETEISDWPAAFEEWLGDHAPFRNGFLTLKSGMDRALGSLDSTNVLLGREGWLFLKNVSDSKSLSDYQGLTSFSAEETETILRTAQALGEELESKGSRLVLLFAPAKEGVYSRYMPDSIPVVSRPTRVEALVETLRAGTSLPVIFPLEELKEAADTCQVYYKYDTHWNEAGAWLAAQQVLGALGLPAESRWPDLAPDPEKTAPTDLANMCGSWRWCTDDVYISVDAPQAACTASENGGELTRYQGGGEESLLLARDSFGSALAPFLAQGFDETLVLHGNLLTPENLAAQQPQLPDVVVLEVAERFADTLPTRLAALLEWAQNTGND